MPLLDIRNLTINVKTAAGIRRAVDRVDICLNEGKIYSLIGESGSGKTLIAKAILGIGERNWNITADRFEFDGIDMLKLSARTRQHIISAHMSLISQDSQRCLNPSMTIGQQLVLSIPNRRLKGSFWSRPGRRLKEAITLLHRVGIKNPKEIMDRYPFAITKGECQKILIAIAIANKPKLLIADEPTNTMDTVTESQIFRLFASLNQNHGTTILLINRDFQMVTNWTDRIDVLYCGQLIEFASSKALASCPHHPYTDALLKSTLEFQKPLAHKSPLYALPGIIPSLENLPIGCRFGPRCPYAQKKCIVYPHLTRIRDHAFACFYPVNMRHKDEHDS